MRLISRPLRVNMSESSRSEGRVNMLSVIKKYKLTASGRLSSQSVIVPLFLLLLILLQLRPPDSKQAADIGKEIWMIEALKVRGELRAMVRPNVGRGE